MYKDMVSVIDFGSSKITVLAGVGEVNNSFKLLASADCDYDGFVNGEFVDSNNLKMQIEQALQIVQNELQCKITNLFVGVPAEFCFAYDKVLTKSFNKSTKITTKIVDELFLDDDEKTVFESHSVINKSPLYYTINDENKTNDPIGLYAQKIQAQTSYILVENKFKLLIHIS